MDTGLPHAFPDIARKFALPHSHIFYFWQCVNFIHTSCREWDKRFRSSIMDRLLHAGSNTISSIYKPLLCKITPSIASSSVAHWGKDFPDPELIDKLLQWYNKVLQLIPCEYWRKTQMKILHCAYIPFLMDKSNPQSFLCPLCNQPKPTLTHCFWSCSSISSFWEQIISLNHIHMNTLHTGYYPAASP